MSFAPLAACGDDDGGGNDGYAGTGGHAGTGGTGGAGTGGSGGTGGSDAGVTTQVAVTVEEFMVSAVPATAPAGEVTFDVTNHGDFQHEFVVLKTDIAPRSLPIVDGEVDEQAAGIEVIDEIEEVMPGETESLTVTLEAGKHVLICNRTVELDDGGVLNHYVQGMSTAFLVE